MALWTKTLATKSDDPSLVIGTHMVGSEKQLLQVFL